MYTLIRAASVTLQQLVTNEFTAEASINAFFGGNMEVSLNTPEEMAANNHQGVSLWLYRIVRDEDRSNQPRVRIATNRLQPPPLPLRLHYLVTPMITINAQNVVNSPLREQLLLGKVLQVFHDTPVIRGAALQSDYTGTSTELAVRLESLGLEEITRVWEGLNASYHLSVSYEVTVVSIGSIRQPTDHVPVEIAMPQYGVITAREDV